MTAPLPVSLLVNVAVILTPAPAQSQALNNLLVLGSSTVIDTVQRIRTYATIAAVAAEFGTTAPEYKAAVLWFEQAPAPTNLMIGRWVQADAAGQLLGGALASTAFAAIKAVAAGGFSVTIDGGAVQHLNALNFTGISNLNGAATIINGTLAGATCAYDGVNNRFVFTSNTTGDGSAVTFLSAPTAGTNLSAIMGGTAATGAYQAPGMDAESAIDAVTLFDAQFGTQWYAVTVLGAGDDDHLSIAPYIEAAQSPIHLYGVSTQEAGVLSSVSTTDIAYLLAQQKYTRTLVQYSSSSPYTVCSLLGRALTVDYTGNNTAITLMYKQEPGVVPESISQTQLAAMLAKNCNAILNYNNNTAIVQAGRMCSNLPIDVRTGVDWLSTNIQTAVYNLLYTSTTKIPQTDAGNHLIANTIEAVLSQGVTNGLLAPGQWNASGFGAITQGDYLPAGYYVYAPPIITQAQADRAARKSVPFQIAAKLAGAVETVGITLNVNQ